MTFPSCLTSDDLLLRSADHDSVEKVAVVGQKNDTGSTRTHDCKSCSRAKCLTVTSINQVCALHLSR